MNKSCDNNKTTIIGVIPQYPKHSQQNIYAKVRMPPVGIISVLSQINQNSDLNVYAIDENNYAGPRDFTDMPDHSFLQDRDPAKIAMFYGGMSNSIQRMFSVAKQYKEFGAITIAGGSHVDALPEEALKSGIDIVVHGEGEHTVQEILDKVLDRNNIKPDYKKELEQIVGISYLDENNSHVFTGKREPIQDLDSLVDADLTLIKFLRKKWTAVPVNRGRGCNYNCEFCVVNKQYGKFKASSIDKSLEQIVKYSDLGYKNFFFTDDNFAQNIPETIELCKMIGNYKREFNKKINLIVQARTEVAENDELIEAMRYGGVTTIAIGFESPINEELKAMKKGVTVEKMVKRSRKLSNYFYLHGMFIFGYPTFKDSKYICDLPLEERAKRYSKFFRKAKLDTIQVLNAVPLPDSKLRAKLIEEGRVFPKETVGWDKYDGLFLCYKPEQGINASDLQELPRILMKNRYLGGFLARNLNYGNWLNWSYYATFGFPLQMGFFYAKRFVNNFKEKKREKTLADELLMPEENIFKKSLNHAWKDIRRKWRNLTITTYGGAITRRWFREYKKSDYSHKLKNFFTKIHQ